MEKYSPFEWLLIDVANQYGHDLDKKMYSDRLLWAYTHLDTLESLYNVADDTASFYAAVQAIRDTQAGRPSGYMIYHDAAASGIQIMSVTTRCAIGMKSTGLINSGRRPDIYGDLTEVMDRYEYSRNCIKLALMTYMYGSEAEPKNLFGEDLDLFFKAANEVAPYAVMLRTMLIKMWQKDALAHIAVFPDGHTLHTQSIVAVDYNITEDLLDKRSFTFRCDENLPQDRSVSLAAHTVHGCDGFIVREMDGRCNYDLPLLLRVKKLIQNSGKDLAITDRIKMISIWNAKYITQDTIEAMSGNFLGRMLELIELCLVHAPFILDTIHDAFGALPNNTQDKRQHYNRIMYDIYHSDLMMDLIEQISGKYYSLPPVDLDVAQAILDNDYAIS